MKYIVILLFTGVFLFNSVVFADNIDVRYDRAAKYYHKLFDDNTFKQLESNWIKTIRYFESIYQNHSTHSKAPAALLSSGKLYRALYQYNLKSIFYLYKIEKRYYITNSVLYYFIRFSILIL